MSPVTVTSQVPSFECARCDGVDPGFPFLDPLVTVKIMIPSFEGPPRWQSKLGFPDLSVPGATVKIHSQLTVCPRGVNQSSDTQCGVHMAIPSFEGARRHGKTQIPSFGCPPGVSQDFDSQF